LSKTTTESSRTEKCASLENRYEAETVFSRLSPGEAKGGPFLLIPFLLITGKYGALTWELLKQAFATRFIARAFFLWRYRGTLSASIPPE